MPRSASSEPASKFSSRFLIDENVAQAVTVFLRDQGHDVLDVKEGGWLGKSDAELLAIAEREGRIIVTYDVDFASVRRLAQTHPGIIFIRLRNLQSDSVIRRLDEFLATFPKRDLRETLAVLEEGRVRFRKTR